MIYLQPTGMGDLGTMVSSEKLERDLNLHASGSGSFGTFSASATADFMQRATSNRYSRTFNYEMTYSATAKYGMPSEYGPDALNSFGRSAYAAGAQAFFNACGDSFVVAANAGTALVMSIIIDFLETTYKETFDASASASWGLSSLSGSISSLVSQYGLQGSFGIQLLQLGGYPNRLPNVFTKGPSGFHVLSCDLTSLDKCQQAIGDVISYAQGDFENQIQFAPGQPVDPELLYVFDTQIVTKYTDIGITLRPAPLTPMVREQQRNLTNWYQKDLDNRLFLGHFGTSQVAPYFTVEAKQFLDTALVHLDDRIAAYDLNGVTEACYGPLANDECDEAYQVMEATRDHYAVNQTIVDHFLFGAFRDQCDCTSDGPTYYIPTDTLQQTYKALCNSGCIDYNSSLTYNSTGLNATGASRDANGIVYMLTCTDLPWNAIEKSYSGICSVFAAGRGYYWGQNFYPSENPL